MLSEPFKERPGNMQMDKKRNELSSRLQAAGFRASMLAGLSVTALSLVSLLGALSPAIDLFSHFRVQYAVLLLCFCAVARIGGSMRYALLFAPTAVVNGLIVASLWLPSATASSVLPSKQITVLDMNVFFENTHNNLIAQQIKKFEPDVVVLEEVTQTHFDALQPDLDRYPNRVTSLRDGGLGIGMFSKLPIDQAKPNLLNMNASFALSGDLKVGAKSLTLIGIHAMPQINPWGIDVDKKIIARLTAFQKTCPNNVVMIGDFNATPWSALFRELIGTGRLIDSEQGFGLQCTWPTNIPFFAIPIDHCVHSPNCRVTDRRLGDFVGSDHLPLLVKISVPQ
jgi:endonuclease/exonuclease/phosphatase (EEP) superfamily protein YafD